MIRRPPRSTLDRSSAASDVYKRQEEISTLPDDAQRRLFVKRMLEDVRALERMLADGWIESGVRRIGAEQETVSYTHLRAHETVLDIVCPLLLEKKKTHVGVDTQHCMIN